ncbi:MAG: response regulator transcription factor [Phycisphaerae bacterium]|nr:response regulator transcription factor [Phycisphaerae bacterium]
MLKILVADDHMVVREGLKQILGEVPDIIVAGEASDGVETLHKIREDHYDLVLLDIAMPGLSGLDVLKQLKSEKPELPVLMLSMYPEEQYAVRTLKAGASGYLTKESASDELIAAIRKVCSGGKYVTASLAEKLASCLDTYSETPVHERLSDREYQVVRMIASGKTVTEIADALCLSVKTISTNRSRALTKMGMKTNAEITYYAIKHDLVE